MALKRKRSSPGFSSPASDTNSESLPFFYAQSKPIEPLYHKPAWSVPTNDDGANQYKSTADMNSRTRKRHRDDRPDEEEVYSNTISRLFNAQRHPPHAQPLPAHHAPHMLRIEQPQRSTLHAFWSVPKPAPASCIETSMVLDMPARPTDAPGLRCEDCEDHIRPDDSMGLDEDLATQEVACASCRRCVCDRCAVLGDERVCLDCANGNRR